MPQLIEDKEGDFYRPVVVNAWGYVGYYLWATQSDWGTWGHAEQDATARLRAGDKVVVQWPDGTETTEVLRPRTYYGSVSDHGHTYAVEGEKLVITSLVGGAPVEVPLENVRVKRA